MVIKTISQFKELIKTGNFSNVNLSLNPNDSNNETTMVNQIQKLDSVHDFGGTRGNNLATDALSKKRGENDFYYDQMRLSFIQKYSFPSMSTIPIQDFSIFSYPGAAPIQRSVDDVENYCVLLAMKNSIQNDSMTFDNNFKFENLPNTGDLSTLTSIKSSLADFFENYIDINGTTKINFIIDTPGDFTKVLKADKTDATNKFAYILTQESAHDSAKGKPTTFEPEIINQTYKGNGFVEAFLKNNQQSRTYKKGNGIGDFESNFEITLNGMQYVPSPKEHFKSNVTYSKQGFTQMSPDFDCILNSLVHPTNVPQITKQVNAFTKGSSLPVKLGTSKELPNINNFYSEFNEPSNNYNYVQNNQNLLDFSFTKKRAGDGLQAKVCQLVNSSGVEENGYLGLPCYKLASTARGAGGVDTNTIFMIQKLVLVTIDRVLFSYCVKNKIPAVYSGTKCFLFFNPTRKEKVSTIFTQTLSQLPAQPSSTQIIKGGRNDTQTAGAIMDDITEYFVDIPFNLFKLLPRILKTKTGRGIVRQDVTLTDNINKLINKITTIHDEGLITRPSNEKICLYYKDYINQAGYNITDKNYLIWLDNPALINVYLDSNNEYFNMESNEYFTGSLSSDITKFTKQDIKQILTLPLENSDKYGGYFLRSDALLDDVVFKNFLMDVFDATEIEGGGINEKTHLKINNFPKLNVYLKFFYNNPISLDTNNISTNNFIALYSYLCIFDAYEINICFDNDKYYQDFEKVTEKIPEVSNKISMYIFFKLLLEDFEKQHDKICYGLMEYFINDGDTNQKYFSIADDLQTQLYYIYCNEIVRPYYVNEIIGNYITEGVINTEDPVFINSKIYFEELIIRVTDKTQEIESYINSPNIQINTELENYIKKYLNMYGFMNMTNDFFELFFEPSRETTAQSNDAIAKGIPGLSTQERLQRIEEQQKQSLLNPKPALETDTLRPFDPSRQKTALDVSTFSNGDASNMVTSKMSTNVASRRGGKTQKNRKKQIKRKTNKHKNNKRNQNNKKTKNTTRRPRRQRRAQNVSKNNR
jgi:hypothetical protein